MLRRRPPPLIRFRVRTSRPLLSGAGGARTRDQRIMSPHAASSATRRNASLNASNYLGRTVLGRCRYGYGTGSVRPRIAPGRRVDAATRRDPGVLAMPGREGEVAARRARHARKCPTTVGQSSFMETFMCRCCELARPNTLRPTAWETYTPPTLCRECIEHQGKPLQRAEDHAREFRRRMEVAIRGARTADQKTAKYLDEMSRAFRSRDRTLEFVDQIANHHQRDAHRGCSCGQRNCPTLRVLSDPWLVERLTDLSIRDSGQGRGHWSTRSRGLA
jgi:hypothetical protein